MKVLVDFAVKHIETFAVLYVSHDESVEKMEVNLTVLSISTYTQK